MGKKNIEILLDIDTVVSKYYTDSHVENIRISKEKTIWNYWRIRTVVSPEVITDTLRKITHSWKDLMVTVQAPYFFENVKKSKSNFHAFFILFKTNLFKN